MVGPGKLRMAIKATSVLTELSEENMFTVSEEMEYIEIHIYIYILVNMGGWEFAPP